MLFWSTGMYKDPAVLLCIATAIYAVLRLLSYGLVIVAVAGAFSVAVRKETLEAQREYDVSTRGGALLALPVGLAYLLFAPLPRAISGVRQLLTLPETLVWYALVPAFVRGLVYSVRHRLRDVLPILVFAVTLTIAYALMQGSVGTAYRQRTQVTMFFFVFMAVGIVQRSRPHAQQPFELVVAAARSDSNAAAIVDTDFVYEEIGGTGAARAGRVGQPESALGPSGRPS